MICQIAENCIIQFGLYDTTAPPNPSIKKVVISQQFVVRHSIIKEKHTVRQSS